MQTKILNLQLHALIGILLMSMSYSVDAVTLPNPDEDQYSIARGGRLYDKWFTENGQKSPKEANPSYPETAAYKGKKGADWRCKECHGWDYQGKNGLYRTGKHYTGITGIQQAQNMTSSHLIETLKNTTHQYRDDQLSKSDMQDLVNFMQDGQVNMALYIHPKTKQSIGNPMSGKQFYNTLCASCHGRDGKAEDTIPPLGELANKNPWEVMHKILNGQPDEEMPAYRALDISIPVDILAYLQQRLPKK